MSATANREQSEAAETLARRAPAERASSGVAGATAAAATAVRPRAPLTPASLRSLQRAAGNRAATVVVSRQSAPAPTDERDGGVGETGPTDGGAPVAGAPGGGQPVAAPTPPTPPNTGGGGGVQMPPPTPAGSGSGAPPTVPARAPIVPTRTPPSGDGDGVPNADPQVITGANQDSSGGPGAPLPDATPTANQDSGGGTPIGPPPPPPPPQPGIWTTLIADLGGGANAARDVLEMLRPIPGYGMLPGMAADTIGMVTDQQQFEGLNEPWTQMITMIRDIVALINNMMGSAAGAVETVQDVATASVVGAEIDAATAPAALTIKQIKLYVDGLQLGLDIFGAAAAAYNAAHAPKGSADLAKNNQIMQMFEANIIGDVVGGVIDFIDMTSAGFTNGDNLKGVGKFLYSFLKVAGPFGRALVSMINGWFGVHGGSLLPTSSGSNPEPEPGWRPAPPSGGGGAGGAPQSGGGAPQSGGGGAPVQRLLAQRIEAGDGAGAAARVVFAEAVVASLDEAQSVWQNADQELNGAIELAHQFEAGARELGTELNDGRDPFLQIRDAAHQALDNMHQHVTELTDLHQYAGDAHDKAQWIISGADTALAGMNAIRLPDIHVPRDQDTGVIASVVNAGAGLADDALQALLTPPRMLLDAAREGLRSPIESAKTHAQEGAEFAQFLQEFAQQAINSLTDKIASFSAALAHVQNGDQFMDMMLRQVTEMLGIPGGVGLDDARAQWNSIGDTITHGQAMAQDLLRRAQADQARGSGGGPTAQTLPTPQASMPDGADDPSP